MKLTMTPGLKMALKAVEQEITALGDGEGECPPAADLYAAFARFEELVWATCEEIKS